MKRRQRVEPQDHAALQEVTTELARYMVSVLESAEPKDEWEVLILGYLARVRALLSSMNALCRSDEHDGIGTLYRTFFETWMHGVYLVLGGNEALGRLKQERDYETTRMDRVFGTKEATSRGTRLSIQDLARLLRDLLVHVEPESAQWPETAYDSHYRVTSYHDAHGHLGSVVPHIDDSIGVLTTRDRAPAHHLLAMGTSLGIGLAFLAATHFGQQTGELAQFQRALSQAYVTPDRW